MVGRLALTGQDGGLAAVSNSGGDLLDALYANVTGKEKARPAGSQVFRQESVVKGSKRR